MAATKYTCRIDTNLHEIEDLKAALNAAGLITSVLYEASGYLIFSSPLISKVIKINLNNLSNCIISYGDAWTSGSTITNEVIFSASHTGTVTNLQIVVDAAWFCIIFQNGNGALFTYIGVTDTSKALLFGLTSRNDSNSYNNCKAYNMTDGVQIYPASFGGMQGLKDGSGNFLTMPLMYANSSDQVLMNGAAPAQISGIKMSSVVSITTPNIGGGAGYILSPKILYHSRGTGYALQSGIVIEYTP